MRNDTQYVSEINGVVLSNLILGVNTMEIKTYVADTQKNRTPPEL